MNRLRFLQMVVASAALLLLLAPATAGQSENPEAIFRAVAQAARIGTPPPPPAGVRDMHWSELSPRGWDARATLRRWTVTDLEENDPRIKSVQAGIRGEWDRAPTIDPPANAVVRLTAFAVPLKDSKQATMTVILAPFAGDGIEAPIPPANQMILVTLNRALPAPMVGYPIWVTGKITRKPMSTRIGRVAYQMSGATWEPYPYQKYPLPQYQWPR